MKLLFALLALLLLTACSHPLEISGQGDIVSSNGRHNCLLEEQPCTNLVTGDYSVTYTAQPRAGWSFDSWEGCGDQFPNCTFDVSGTQVAQYWGQVMPPLRATFSKDIPRRKVLIILDDSASMANVAYSGGEKAAYDSDATYADAGFDAANVYWSTDSSKPEPGTNHYFAASSNRCEASFTPLAEEGNIWTAAKRWQPANGSVEIVTREVCNGSRFWYWCSPDPPGWEIETGPVWVGDAAGWEDLSTSDHTPTHVECQADVLSAEEGNGPYQAAGLPNQPSSEDAPDSEAYTTGGHSNVDFGSTYYKWYSAHYLNWWYDTSTITVAKTRMEVARDVINSVITTNTSLDFGLAVFNDNSDGAPQHWPCDEGICVTNNSEGDNGGRIVHAIIENMTAADRNALAGPNGLTSTIEPGGWAPLSETFYETFRYLTGTPQMYGDKRDVTTGHHSLGVDTTLDTPAPDPRAYVGGYGDTYKSPYQSCGNTYIILLTDGFPSFDKHANAAIEALTGETCEEYPDDVLDDQGNRVFTKNCLPTLTKYMANNDLDQDSGNGYQLGITHTIGFTTDQELLKDAAQNGKGEYFTTDSRNSLMKLFEWAISGILNTRQPYCE